MDAPAAPAPEQNPFLAADPGPPRGVVSSAPELPPESAPLHAAPQPAPAQPRVVPPAAGAPLQVQPGAVAPTVSDPHAEFRKGNWKKPVALIALAAAAAGGLVFGLPAEEESAATAAPTPKVANRDNAVIGASVSPEVIDDPDSKSATTAAKPEPAAPAEPAAEPSDQGNAASSGSFAAAFKSNAK